LAGESQKREASARKERAEKLRTLIGFWPVGLIVVCDRTRGQLTLLGPRERFVNRPRLALLGGRRLDRVVREMESALPVTVSSRSPDRGPLAVC
jgi:hypothetical protein